MNKTKYNQFCKMEDHMPLQNQPWWLDAVYGKNNWDVILVEKGGKIIASFPYSIKRKIMFKIIAMPILTQRLAIYIKYPEKQKYAKRKSLEKKVTTKIIDSLPGFDLFSMNLDYSLDSWLPFSWKGFKQSTNYTYIIENIKPEELFQGFDNDIRRRIKKAQEAGIVSSESSNIRKFYNLNKQTFERQNRVIPYSFKFIENFYKACVENNACRMQFAKDSNGEVIATSFLVYDKQSVYYLMGGVDSAKRKLGGMDLLLYEGIKFAMETGRKFDFEGSMVESIEKYFKGFGGKQVAYSQITKINSRLLKIRECFMELLK